MYTTIFVRGNKIHTAKYNNNVVDVLIIIMLVLVLVVSNGRYQSFVPWAQPSHAVDSRLFVHFVDVGVVCVYYCACVVDPQARTWMCTGH